jgi:hypothetical protein
LPENCRAPPADCNTSLGAFQTYIESKTIPIHIVNTARGKGEGDFSSCNYSVNPANKKIAFYVSYGRPMAKVLLIAAITYQIIKFAGGLDEKEVEEN